MAKLGDTAQQVMDSFYQDLKADEQFLDIGYFKIECLAARNFFLEQEYYATRRGQGNEGNVGGYYPMFYLDGEWIRTEKLIVKFDTEQGLYYSELPYSVMNFPIDNWNMGVQRVHSMSGKDFIRIRTNSSWETKLVNGVIPSIYYYSQGNRIYYEDNGITMPKTVLSDLIAGSDACNDDDEFIPDLKQYDVMQMVLKNAFQYWNIRNGKISVTDNQNPNMVNETDTKTMSK